MFVKSTENAKKARAVPTQETKLKIVADFEAKK
jgi:hypothetical protein